MKTITINSQDFVTSTASTLEIKLSKLPKNIKVVDAMLNFKFASNPTFPARIDYYNSLAPSQCVWQNVDKVSSSTEYLLNISDELQDCLNKKADSIIFKTSTASTFQKSGELKISYITMSQYQNNGNSHSLDLGNAGSLSIDIGTQECHLSTQLLSSDNNPLSLSIEATYNENTPQNHQTLLPEGWNLNLQQFLIDNGSTDGRKTFTYIDGNMKEHIFEEKFYYYDENDKKQYLNDLNLLKIKPDGTFEAEISGKTYEIKQDFKNENGLSLVSSIKDIKGAELIDYEPEELANLRQQIKQLEENKTYYLDNQESLKNQIFMTCISKYVSGNSILRNYLIDEKNSADKELSYNETFAKIYGEKIYHSIIDENYKEFDQFFGENKLFAKNELNSLLNQLTHAAQYKFSDMPSGYDWSHNDETKHIITFEDISDHNENGQPYVKCTYGDTELLNFEITLKNYEKQYKNNSEKLDEIENLLKKYNHKLDLLEMQSPVHYLYDENNIIYGFGKTSNENLFRLILIGDVYENVIFISYDSFDSNKIASITDSGENNFVFDYEKDKLLSITDPRNRTVKFIYKNGNISQIIHPDKTTSNYYYTSNKLCVIVDQNGKGASITRTADQTILQGISILEKVENGKIFYKNGINYVDLHEKTPNFFNSYKIDDEKLTITRINNYTTSITDSKGRMATYLFDKFGKINMTYEGHFSEDEDDMSVKTSIFDYQNSSLSEKLSTLPYSENYLSDACFNNETIQEVPALYLGTDYCSNNTFAYTYKTCAKFHTINASSTTKTDTLHISNTMLAKLNSNQQSCPHKTFLLSGWAKANSLFIKTDETDTLPAYVTNRKFELSVNITYQDNSTQTLSKSFDWRNTDWQYTAIPIKLKNIAVKGLTCTFAYSNNDGAVSYTDLELKEADWEKVTYDNLDRIIKKETAHSSQVITYQYDGDSKSVSKEIITQDGKTFTTSYEYNPQGNLIRTIDYNKIVKENVYDKNGTIIKTVTYHLDQPSSKFYEEEKLDEKGKTKAQINPLGEETDTFDYQSGTGIITSQTDENGVKTAFGYDDNDRIIEKSITVNGIENTNTYGYTLDYLTSLKHNNFAIDYNYDGKGRISSVKLANRQYLNKSYSKGEFDDTIETTTLASGEIYKNVFNKDGKLTDVYYKRSASANEELIAQNIYDIYGNLVFKKDYTQGPALHKYYIDNFGNTYLSETSQNGQTVKVQNTFDASHDKITKTQISIGNKTQTYSYSYDLTPDKRPIAITLPNNLTQNLSYDNLGRISSLSCGNFSKHFSYLKSGDHTSNLTSLLQFAHNGKTTDNLRYCYDKKGNISEIRQNNLLLARFQYDALSRIVREDNKALEKTFTFSYDAGGNITQKKEYPFTLIENLDTLDASLFNYSYSSTGWKDQLLSFNGQPFAYDLLGNPTLYRGKNLTWSHARQLDRFANIADYKYNADGIRTSKVVHTNNLDFATSSQDSSFETKFILNGNKIISQIDPCNTLTFHYGADGLTGFHIKSENATYKGQPLDHDFIYQKNAQNDIIGIYSTNGDKVIEYAYDAFGSIFVKNSEFCKKIVDNEISSHYNDTSDINLFIALKNPFRYRSYYYDFETNLYYLNSRYYDPETGRFVNADDIAILNSTKEVLNGLNLYAYCLNNPINSTDDNGDMPNWLKWLIGGFIILAAAVITIVSAGLAGIGIGAAFMGALGFGSAVGGFTGFMAGVTVGATIGGVIGIISGGITSFISGENIWDGMSDGFLWGAGSGAISGGFSTFKFGGFGDILNKYTNKPIGNKIHIIGQSIISMTTYFAHSTANGEQITPFGTALSIFNGVVGGLMYHANYKTQLALTLLYEIIIIATEGLKEFLKNRRIKTVLI
ncbi:MAG: hypothetical protein HFI85_03665 [Clostridia bacterium]|jgi:RHS repeat-associated protein|nr:hypothetical protein [Clostridia bacterium]